MNMEPKLRTSKNWRVRELHSLTLFLTRLFAASQERHCLLSCLAPRIGSQYHRREKLVPLPDGVDMFPKMLRDAGYYTTNNAKKDYNVVEGDSVWNESGKKASWRNRQKDQPFFHVQTFHQSHEGSLHFNKQQFRNGKQQSDLASAFVAPNHPDTEMFRYTATRYHNRIQTVDREVGKILKRLEKDGLTENTIVFYFSDHGGVLPGSKGYLYETGLHIPLVVYFPERLKHLMPGFAMSDGKCNAFVSFIDFGATVLNLAGLPAIKGTDGRAFLGDNVDTEKWKQSRNWTLGYADRFDEKYDLVRSIRIGKYKYIRNFQPLRPDGLQNNYRYKNLAWREWRELFENNGLSAVQAQFFKAKPPEALFDVVADPYETKNLAKDEQHRSKLIELRMRLMSELKSMPDLGIYPECFLINKAFENPVAFGQENQTEIAKLIDIANLGLKKLEDVEGDLMQHLSSENPWHRYWAIQACGSFFQDAIPTKLIDKLLEVSNLDEESLNQAVAAEFLGAATPNDIDSVFAVAIKRCDSKVKAAMILNSVVLLNDFHGKKIPIQREWFNKWSLGKKDNVKRRLDYLLSDDK